MSFAVKMLGLAVMLLMIGCGQSAGETLTESSIQNLSGRRCMMGSPSNGYLLVDNVVEVKQGQTPSYCHGFLSFELPEAHLVKAVLVIRADEAYISPDPALPPLNLSIERISFESMVEVEMSEYQESGEITVLTLDEVQGESVELRIDVTDIIDPSQNLQQFRLKVSYGHLDNIHAELEVTY